MNLNQWDEVIEMLSEPMALYLPYREFSQLASRSAYNGELFTRGWDQQGIYVRSARGTVIRPSVGGVVVLDSGEFAALLNSGGGRTHDGEGSICDDDIPF